MSDAGYAENASEEKRAAKEDAENRGAGDSRTGDSRTGGPEVERPAGGREQLLDRLMRLQAEFENYRKRMDKERTAWQARALEVLVLDLLPALDSFDRALADVGDDAPAPEAVVDGMRLVHKQLLDALGRNGVEPIDALGERFDPNLHEAFASRPPAEGERAGAVVEEYVKGYRMGDRIIRATKAVVAAEPEADSGAAEGPAEVDDASPEEV